MRDYPFSVVANVDTDVPIANAVSRLLQFAVENRCRVSGYFRRTYYRETTELLVGYSVDIKPGDSFPDKVMEVEEGLNRELEIRQRIRIEEQNTASDFSNGEIDF